MMLISERNSLKYYISALNRYRNYKSAKNYLFDYDCDFVDMWGSKNNFVNDKYKIFINWLPSLLRYEDRNSMAYGIESRLPFLDYRLVEYCLNLPNHQLNKDLANTF